MLPVLRYWPMIAVLVGLYLFQSGWMAILLYHLQIFASLVHSKDKSPQQSATKGFHFALAIGAIVIGLCAAPAVYFLLPFLLQQTVLETGAILAEGLSKTGLGGISFWIFFLYFCTIHSVLEELGWRGLLKVDSPWPHLRDFEFAAYHLLVIHYFFPNAYLLFATVFLTLAGVSVFWRRLGGRLGGLSVPILSHIAGDAGVMIAVWMLVRESAFS